MEYAQLMHNNGSDGHGYGVATFNLNSRTGQPNSSKYGIAYGHLGATYGYDSILAYFPGLEFVLTVATNIENNHQTPPSDVLCFAYNAVAGAMLGKQVTCEFKDVGYFGGGCTCAPLEDATVAMV